VSKAPVSTVVVAQNEERHIERCLASVKWTAEIVVVDACSEDRTAELAGGMGAHVIEHEWSGYAAQKNFAIAQATQRWIFSLDADEEVTPELAAEIQEALSDPEIPEAGFRMRVPLYFLGRQLGHYGRSRHDIGHPRLFRKDRARFADVLVHEEAVVDGPVGTLKGVILNDSYPSPALRSYWRKINQYARLEAQERALTGTRKGNRWLRAFGKLGWMLVIRGGLFDGPRAWLWIAGQAYQEWLAAGGANRLRRSSAASLVRAD
jgi:glycosyltransferase involved in cell wall biosynthesis